MSKKNKRDKRDSRKKRKFQGEQLEKRIKHGQDKQGFKITYIKEGVNPTYWRPKTGQHTIDIIPYYAGKNDPTVEKGNETYTFEYLVHKGVGSNNKWMVCPSMYDKPCPICEYRQQLRSKDDDRYKQYFPKTRNMYNIVCQDDSKERKKGVQLWDVSDFYFEQHLMAISLKPSRAGKEERRINFAHPEKGKSIVFTIEPAKGEDDYPSYIGHSFDDRDYEIDDDLIENAHVLDELIVVESYETIKKEFFGKDGKPVNKKSNKKDKKGKNMSKDKDVDYDDLLEELDEIDDNDDLQEFIDDNGFDEDVEIDEDDSVKKNKKKVKKHLESLQEDSDDSDSDEDEDDEDSDSDDDDNDSDDDDEDEDEKPKKKKGKEKDKKGKSKKEKKSNKKNKKDKKPKYTREDIEELSFKKLCKLIEKEGLDDIDLDDYDKDDIDDLVDEVCEALNIEDEDD